MTRSLGVLILSLVYLFAAVPASAQSSDQLFPTPVKTNEIVGTIKARDVGDARLTTYFYTFEGEQGDLFINVQSKNFTGDIDVFVTSGLRPLTKVVMYADQPESETGRVVYLRKPERLLLRVQGRSPGDDDATVRIKFAGSFAASRVGGSGEPEVPRVESSTDSNIRVNSVGTILEVIPKAEPSPDASAENKEPESRRAETGVEKTDTEITPEAKENEKEAERPKVAVIVSDKTAEAESDATPKPSTRASRRNRRTRSSPAPAATDETAAAGSETISSSRRRSRASAAKREEEPKVDPMAGIRLVVYFKDGSTIERPMTEVQRFAVERAVLTVISKNGTIGRYKMTDVSRVSIE